jgi:hypothetical protein
LVIAIARGRPGAPPDEILPQQAPGPGHHERRAANERSLGVTVPEDILRQVHLVCDASGISVRSYILTLLAKDRIA